MDTINLNNNRFYTMMLARLKKKKWIHNKSSNYFNNMQKYVMYPSVCITALSSIASFLSTSDVVSANVKTSFSISVGVFASISTLLQSISSSCNYSTRSELHRTAAEEYDKLITKINFEIELPNEKDFIEKMETKILDIQTKCKYIPPQFIIDEYENKYENINENTSLINQ
tara:strand:- start:74 stop:586 length:513 start_codon:yes stop_codon:yes gene_type:complete